MGLSASHFSRRGAVWVSSCLDQAGSQSSSRDLSFPSSTAAASESCLLQQESVLCDVKAPSQGEHWLCVDKCVKGGGSMWCA